MKIRPEIVLTEDNAADVFLVRSALEESGLDYRLHVLTDGEEALRFLETFEDASSTCPDLLILDLNLPKVSGAEILARLRNGNRCSSASVIVLTSSDSARDRESVALLGVRHYFLKTANLHEFMKLGGVVRQVLDSRQAQS